LKGHRGKTALGLVLTVVLLWWVLRDVSPSEVMAELRAADPWLLTGAVVLATFSFVLRALRWRVLLLPVHRGSRFDSRFGATCIGFTVNNLLPARLGEFARAYALARSETISMSASFASLVVERIFDGLVLAFFLFTTISLPGFPLGEGSSSTLLRRTANVGALIFLVAFAILWLAARHPERSVRFFEGTAGRLMGTRLRGRVSLVLASFIQGLGALQDPAVFLRAMAWSLIVWLNLAASIWLGLLAFDIVAPGFTGAMFLQALIGFAVATPSSPGFFGVFEAASRLGLELYGIDAARIVSFATSYHILTFIPVTLIGLWYLRRFGMTWAEVGQSEEIVESEAP
jgi:uncharacterized protein (TIRG00374 family)